MSSHLACFAAGAAVACAATGAVAAPSGSAEQTFHLDGRTLRAQALSTTLLRVEEIGPLGPLDRDTNLVVGRGAFPGEPLTVVSQNTSSITLRTTGFTAVISTAAPDDVLLQPPPQLPVSRRFDGIEDGSAGASCKEGHIYPGFQPMPPSHGTVHRSKHFPNGVHADGPDVPASCCALCATDPSCSAFVSYERAAHTDRDDSAPNCWPLQGDKDGSPWTGALEPMPDRVTYTMAQLSPPSPPPPPPPPPLHLAIAVKGRTLYDGPVGDAVPFKVDNLPEPSGMYSNAAANGGVVWSVRDSPRFVPPAWGATPAPAGAKLGPLANTSGYDQRYAGQPDCYFFIAPISSGAKGAVLSTYSGFRTDYYRLFGPVPLLPDWAWGFWFTWYHNYTQAEKTTEIRRFIDEKIPMDVVSLDMDWRNLTVDYLYEVNTELFPDMPGFLKFVHANGKRSFFNDHPAPLGSNDRNPAPEMSPAEIKFRWQGQTSILDQGLDFWWFDCHWKFSVPAIKLPGTPANDVFDYKAWGQRVFWDVMTRYYRENRPEVNRTVMLGCAGSGHPANHRTPVWWTGDNYYAQLASAVQDEIEGGIHFSPYVHPDCTGHHGVDEVGDTPYPPEVYARWVQFCTFGTIYRIHSSHLSKGRRPWSMGPEVEDIMRNFTRMRYAMIPTLVAAGAATTDSGLPMVRRLDLEWPEEPSAARTDQYLLGDDVFVAPVDPFAHNGTNNSWNADKDLWLPPGSWVDAFTGAVTGGGDMSLRSVPLRQAPIYHRGSGMLVTFTDDTALSTAAQDWSRLTIDVHALPFPPPAAGAGAGAATASTVVRKLAQPEHRGGGDGAVLRKTAFANGTVALRIEGAEADGLGAWTVNVHLAEQHGTQMVRPMLDGRPVHPSATTASETRRLPFGVEAPGRTHSIRLPMDATRAHELRFDVVPLPRDQ